MKSTVGIVVWNCTDIVYLNQNALVAIFILAFVLEGAGSAVQTWYADCPGYCDGFYRFC